MDQAAQDSPEDMTLVRQGSDIPEGRGFSIEKMAQQFSDFLDD